MGYRRSTGLSNKWRESTMRDVRSCISLSGLRFPFHGGVSYMQEVVLSRYRHSGRETMREVVLSIIATTWTGWRILISSNPLSQFPSRYHYLEPIIRPHRPSLFYQHLDGQTKFHEEGCFLRIRVGCKLGDGPLAQMAQFLPVSGKALPPHPQVEIT